MRGVGLEVHVCTSGGSGQLVVSSGQSGQSGGDKGTPDTHTRFPGRTVSGLSNKVVAWRLPMTSKSI